jgi:hypothetical protein
MAALIPSISPRYSATLLVVWPTAKQMLPTYGQRASLPYFCKSFSLMTQTMPLLKAVLLWTRQGPAVRASYFVAAPRADDPSAVK